jgi:hypothetical protein
LELEGADLLVHPFHILLGMATEAGLLEGEVSGGAHGTDVELVRRLGRLVDLAGAVALRTGALGLGEVELVVVDAVAVAPGSQRGKVAVVTLDLFGVVLGVLFEIVVVLVVAGLAVLPPVVESFLRILRGRDPSDPAGPFFRVELRLVELPHPVAVLIGGVAAVPLL